MNEHIAHSGAWGIALIVIVIASWVLYRYLAPKTWREWASAGVIQAFIIALYAEMYGFPLTIYLLVRFFGLDQTNLNANLWSTLLGFGETGMMIAMILGYVLLFAGIGVFIEGWRELHRARQENRLVTDRLYGLVRPVPLRAESGGGGAVDVRQHSDCGDQCATSEAHQAGRHPSAWQDGGVQDARRGSQAEAR
ncbi:MAG: hypothetical protein SCH98_04345 [Deferrisomatales bacterium]|nr:hypothetical protein [Deferrisomatales bacterium]